MCWLPMAAGGWPDACALTPAALPLARTTPCAGQQHHAGAAQVDRAVEAGEIFRVERHDDHAVERSVFGEHLAGELDRPFVAGAAQHRLADEQSVLRGVELDAKMLAVAEIDGTAGGCEIGCAQQPVPVGKRDLEGEVGQRQRALAPGWNVEMIGIALIGLAHGQQRLVGLLDRADDVFLERAGEVAGALHRAAQRLGALDRHGVDHRDPDQGDAEQSQDGGTTLGEPAQVAQVQVGKAQMGKAQMGKAGTPQPGHC